MRIHEILAHDPQQLTEEQLMEIVPALIAAGVAAVEAVPEIMALVAEFGPEMGAAARSVLGWAVKNPVKAGVAGSVASAAVSDPAAVLHGAMAMADIVQDPGAAAAAMAEGLFWTTVEKAIDVISGIVGVNLPKNEIVALARLAVTYRLPVAAVIAMLYGGAKLYQYLSAKTPPAQTVNAVGKVLPGTA